MQHRASLHQSCYCYSFVWSCAGRHVLLQLPMHYPSECIALPCELKRLCKCKSETKSLVLDFVTWVLYMPAYLWIACLSLGSSIDSLVRCGACALHHLLGFRSTHIVWFDPSIDTFVPTVCIGMLRSFWCWDEFPFWCLPPFLLVLPSRFVVTQLFVSGYVFQRHTTNLISQSKRVTFMPTLCPSLCQ